MAVKVYGLVLAGGKSTRMGTDKGAIAYHGKPHREYLYGLLSELCDEIFMSIRKEQERDLGSDFKTLVDIDEYKGPFNGLLSAHQKYPGVAWLVVATDLPLLKKKDLQQLLQARKTEKIATAFATRKSELPEPLCAIWEPSAFKQAEDFIQKTGKTCPRKFLINSDVERVFPDDDQVVMNANSREEYEQAIKKLKEVEF